MLGKIPLKIIFFILLLFFVLLAYFNRPKDYTIEIVDYVIDGDTIVLKNGEHVRYIGIDTPEKGDCFWKEATNFNKKLVEGKTVKLIKDKENRDKYGRLLRYVYVNDIFVNEELVKLGYAEEFLVPPNNKYSYNFNILEDRAKNLNLGIWKKCNN
jgi:micrococcal nuclease